MKFLYFLTSLFCILQSTLFFASEAPKNAKQEPGITFSSNNQPKEFFELVRRGKYRGTDESLEEGMQILYSIMEAIESITIHVDGTLPPSCNEIKELAANLRVKIIENSQSSTKASVSFNSSQGIKLIEKLLELMAQKIDAKDSVVEEWFGTGTFLVESRMSSISISINSQDCSLPTDSKALHTLKESLGFIPIPNHATSLQNICNREIPSDVNQFLTYVPQVDSKKETERDRQLSYGERAILAINPATAKLFRLMEEKKSNIGLHPHGISLESIIDIFPNIAPYICLLKINPETLEDFSLTKIQCLKDFAKNHGVMILNDSRFADNSKIVKARYAKGLYEIALWADFVTVHAVESINILKKLKTALSEANITDPRGALVITQTLGLFTLDYTKTVLNAVRRCENPFLAGIEHVSYVPAKYGHIKIQQEEIPLNDNYAKQHIKAVKKGSQHDISFLSLDFNFNKSIPIDTLRELQKSSWKVYEKSLMPKGN